MLRWLRRGQGNGAGAAAVVKATAYESAGDVADEDLRAKLEAARLRQEKAEKEERRRRKGRARQTAKDAGPVKETKVEVETQLEEDAAKLMARRRTIVEEGAGVAMPTRQSPPPSPDAANPELVEKLSRARARTAAEAGGRIDTTAAARTGPAPGASEVDAQVQAKLERARNRAESSAAANPTPLRARKKDAEASEVDAQVQAKLEKARNRAESSAAANPTPLRARKKDAEASEVDAQVQAKLEKARNRAESSAAANPTPRRTRPGDWDNSAKDMASFLGDAKGKLRMGAASVGNANAELDDADVRMAEDSLRYSRAILKKTKASSLEGNIVRATSQPNADAVVAGSIAASNFRCPDRRLGELGRVLRKARDRSDRLVDENGAQAPIRAESKNSVEPMRYVTAAPPQPEPEEPVSPSAMPADDLDYEDSEGGSPSPAPQMMPITPAHGLAAPKMMPMTVHKDLPLVPIKQKAEDEPMGRPVLMRTGSDVSARSTSSSSRLQKYATAPASTQHPAAGASEAAEPARKKGGIMHSLKKKMGRLYRGEPLKANHGNSALAR